MMSLQLPPALARAYQRWRQLDVSFGHLAMGRHDAPLYDVENDLDHLHSSLCAEMDELMTGAGPLHRSHAGENLAVLAHVEGELTRVPVGEEEKQMLFTYIHVTRALVEELERFPAS